MTEPVFQIISRKRALPVKSKDENPNSYSNLFQNYLSQSYGYYSELFIKRICEKIQSEHEKLRKFQLRKVLREIIQKYMLNDLQIIYLQYFADLHQCNYSHSLIIQSVQDCQTGNEPNQLSAFKLFLHLISFFVKTYVGSKDQVLALIDFHNQKLPGFSDIYQIWLANNPEKLFHISPRDLNQIYSQYSRSCGEKINKKDYNRMVDKILDLSTTYSIIPSKQKDQKQKKIFSRPSKQLIPVFEKKSSLRNFDSNIWQLQNSFKMDFSDLRSHKKQSLHFGSSALIDPIERAQQSNKNDVIGPRKISLNKKNKISKDEVNNATKSFFRGKDLGLSVDDIKKNENGSKDIVPNSFLDMNNHSSRIQSLPLPYRNNSNLLNFSQLF